MQNIQFVKNSIPKKRNIYKKHIIIYGLLTLHLPSLRQKLRQVSLNDYAVPYALKISQTEVPFTRRNERKYAKSGKEVQSTDI